MANPYLEFKGTASFTLKTNNTSKNWNGTLQYSTDGSTWSTWSGSDISSTSSSPYVLYLRGTGNTYITRAYAKRFTFTTTGTIDCIGRIDTLLDYQTVQNGGTPTMGGDCYAYMFDGCKSLTSAPALPATTLTSSCYSGMFSWCTALTSAPTLPATTLASDCYAYMFQNCTSLTTAPVLPATALASSCYDDMFDGCTSLTSAPALPATTLEDHCYSNMFSGCTSLTTVPVLPATTLDNYCYQYMFRNCTSLTSTPALPATTLAYHCYYCMFYGCTSLTSIPELPATTLQDECYCYMFKNCSNIKISTTQGGIYQTAFSIPPTEDAAPIGNETTQMFYGTGGTFTGDPTINTTYYIAHKYTKNVELNVKWIENTSMTPSGLTAGKNSAGYVTENVSRTLGNLVHCVKRTDEMLNSYMTDLSYMQYIMEGMMTARLVDYENLSQTFLLGDFNRLNCYKNRRRCNVRANGTITAFYGESGYVESYSDINSLSNRVDVMVYQPKFYYKVEPLKLEAISGYDGYHIRKAIYYISDSPFPGFKLHPAFINQNGHEVDYCLIGAFEGSLYDYSASGYDVAQTATADTIYDTLSSVSGCRPLTGFSSTQLTATNANKLCTNKGTGWYAMSIKQYSMNQLMFLIEYGLDSQTAVGRGVVDITDNTSYACSSYCGSTGSLGNNTGSATSTINRINTTNTTYSVNGKVAVSYRGMENPWGNVAEHAMGCTIYDSGSGVSGGSIYIADDFNYVAGRRTTNYTYAGWTIPSIMAEGFYISAFGYGGEDYDWLFMGSENANSAGDTLIKDHNASSTSNGTTRIPVIGGRWNADDAGGIFYWRMDYSYTAKDRGVGARITYYPD